MPSTSVAIVHISMKCLTRTSLLPHIKTADLYELQEIAETNGKNIKTDQL